MDLNTISEVICPPTRAAIPFRQPGDAYLAGGTWLFSEPQHHLRRLVDLTALAWPPLNQTDAGLDVSATCTLATLDAFDPPADRQAAILIRQCCRALLGSFKIRGQATIGGNLCLALPASPMAALVVALEGTCVIWRPDGGQYTLPAAQLILGANRTALLDGDILRSVRLPDAALRRRSAFRQISLTTLGRSAALLIGTLDPAGFALTITASVSRPVRLAFDTRPTRTSLRAAIDSAIPVWLDDVHGRPDWRARMTHLLAAEIGDELSA